MPRVYLCDDQRNYRMLLKAVLTTEEDLEVVGEGGDGRFCIEDAVRHDPDVLLLDVNMPRMNGLEALPQLRDAMPDAAILVLTSSSAAECERDALERGASGFIEKPRNIFDLPGMIREKLAEAGLDQ